MKLPERIPALAGSWLTAHRILWWILLVAAIASLPAYAIVSHRGKMANEQIYAFGLRGSFIEEQFYWSPISDHPGLRGVAPRSTITAVNGEPFDNDLPREKAVYRLVDLLSDSSTPARFDLNDAAGKPYHVTIQPSPAYLAASDAETGISFNARYWVGLTSNLLINVLAILTSILLFRRRVQEPVPALLTIGFLAVVANSGVTIIANEALQRFALATSAMAASLAILTGILTFPDGKLRPRLVWLGLGLILLYQLNLIALGLGLIEIGDTLIPTVPIIIGIMLIVVISLVVRYRRETEEVRRQMKWGALGISGLALFYILAVLISRAGPYVEDPSVQGIYFVAASMSETVAIMCLLGGLLVSLLRYRFYDAEVAMGNGVWVAGLTASLLLIFAGSEKIFEVLGEQMFGADMGVASGAIAAGLAAVLAGPLHHRIHGWAERTFQRKMVRLRDGLPLLVADLRETEPPGRLAETALAQIDSGVRATGYALLFRDGEEKVILATREVDERQVKAWLGEHPLPDAKSVIDKADPLFPLRVPLRAEGVEFEATLLVGRRPDDTLIGKDERKALDRIADPLARALAISLYRTRRIEAETAERSALKERIAKLERWMKGQGSKPNPA